MWKLRIGALVTSSLLGLCLAPGASAATGGDSNAGDVWLESHGQLGDPGHEMDPHLACQDIDLGGSGLSDGSASFTIEGWSPSGNPEVDYSGTWSYTPSGDQVIAVISVSQLISQAKAHGETSGPQGFHFKLDFTQDPQKHKTFWVDCAPNSSGGGGSTGGGSTGGGSTPPSGGTKAGSPTSTGSVSAPPVTTSTTGSVRTAIGAVSARRHVTHRHRGKLVHPARHRRVRRRHAKAVRVLAPPFTG